MDLYIAIKYMKSEELNKALSEKDAEKWTIKLPDDCCDWFMCDDLEHCLYNANDHRYRNNTYLFEYIQNILILLGRIEFIDEQKKKL